MPYRIITIEVTHPFPTIAMSAHETGVAILLRHQGRPVDFWLQALPPGSVLTPSELARRVSTRASPPRRYAGLRNERLPPVQCARTPVVTVAICTKDHPETLARCLKSLKRLAPLPTETAPPGEILVVDNAPSDPRTREVVSALSEVRYVCEPKPGLGFARNRALREARGELLAFLDDDVVVDHGWFSGLLKAWAAHQDAAAFTGLVLPYELATEAQILFERRGGFRRGFVAVRYGQTYPGDPFYPARAERFGTGANMAFRTDVLQELGEFDEALDTGAPLPGGGDLDIFYRVIRAGYPLVYEPQYLVFHQHRREMQALRDQYRKSWGTGFMAFLEKSYRTDPAFRPQLRRLAVWWFGKQLWDLQKSLRGRFVLPPTLVLAQLRGGMVGLLGGYARSVKRVERIRRRFT